MYSLMESSLKNEKLTTGADLPQSGVYPHQIKSNNINNGKPATNGSKNV